MDDFVVNVRQISQYPQKSSIDVNNDAFLLQQGGLGGPYAWTNVSTMLSSFSQWGFSAGIALPQNAQGLIGSSLTTQNGSNQGWNWYRNSSGGQQYLRTGVAGQWMFANGSLTFSISPQGQTDMPIQPAFWQQLFSCDWSGNFSVAQQINVGRDPVARNEVATLDWIRRNTVTSFNGRSGAIALQLSDLKPLVRTPEDPSLDSDGIATMAWVQSAISFRLTDMLGGYPFVNSFNGRREDVRLRLSDVMEVFFRSGAKPLAPTPPAFDASLRIANTRWVMDEIENIQLKEGPPGPVGPQGPVGTGFNFRGTLPDEPSLPPSGNEVGDLFITSDTNTGWVWDGSAWNPIGIISPTANVYVSDFPPAAANAGDLWWSSSTGELSLYYQGPSGLQWVIANTGIQGQQGPEGPPGQPGPNVSIGTGPPPLPTAGRMWFNPTTGVTQVFDGTNWQAVSSEPGATVSVGPTAPASPNDGDLWWDANNGDLMVWYVGPSGGQWVAASAGAQGPPGAPGAPGAPGVAGPPGVQGPPGTGLTLLGSVPTETALPPTGNAIGDMWVTDDTQELFTWDGTQWQQIGVGGGIAEAPTGMPGNPIYGRQNAAWIPLLDDGVW